jgi:hypothetical protein
VETGQGSSAEGQKSRVPSSPLRRFGMPNQQFCDVNHNPALRFTHQGKIAASLLPGASNPSTKYFANLLIQK